MEVINFYHIFGIWIIAIASIIAMSILNNAKKNLSNAKDIVEEAVQIRENSIKNMEEADKIIEQIKGVRRTHGYTRGDIYIETNN